jgi:heat shock protein HtpX
MVPVAWAAASVWQPPQPPLANTALPFVESPLRWKAGTIGNAGAVETVPTTVCGVGDTTPSEPQPARTMAPSAAAATMTAGWRTAEDSNEPLSPADAGTGGVTPLSTIRVMKRKNFGRDRGLSLRMLLTSALLGLLYVVFAVVLFSVFNFSVIAMLVIVIGIAVFQYFSSAKIALAASGAKIVSAEEAPELHAMVERLCAMANLPKPRVAIVDSDVPNAFATGRNPKHAAVAVTSGLWRRLEPQEIEAVLGHELSHIANRDVLVMTVASFFAMLAAMLTRFGLYAGMFGGFGGGFGGGNRGGNNNQTPVWLIVFLVSVVVYAISWILIRTISRYREYAADRGSAIITGAPENLMSALQKISSNITQIPQRDLREVQGMNAFFIIPTNWKTNMSEWMMDHPPLEKRLAALSQIAREMGKPVS